MPKEFKASTTINASPDKIWAILTDASAYPEWEPSVSRIEGRIAPGETLKVHSKLSPGRTFPVKVKEFTPGQRMTWEGGMPLGLFKGVRSFTLTPEGEAQHFELREVFSGPMLFMIGPSLPDLTRAFQDFCAGLKARAEAL